MNESTSERILIVDDERSVVEVVSLYMQREGFDVCTAFNGREALDAIAEKKPTLVVLDLMLPELDGLEILRRVRDSAGVPAGAGAGGNGTAASPNNIPIIVLSARRQETDRIHGLEIGADDYVTKPFSPAELVARVKAVLRRTRGGAMNNQREQTLNIGEGEVMIDPASRQVEVRGESVDLTATEFNLLYFMASHPNQVFSRTQLLENVWGFSEYVDPSTVTVHIRRLREKIEIDASNPDRLLTVWGVGYKFVNGQ
jgi:two-component system response regulator VicR